MPAAVKLNALELGRALAALAVVAHHAGQASDAFTSGVLGHRFEAGALGVDFFFVLSGFIIFYVHHRDPKNTKSARKYLGRRLRRIYVPYLPIGLLMIVAYTLLPGLSQGNRDWSLFTSLTLLPSGSPPALSVAWTLVYEMIFYIFFLIFFFTRHFWWIVAVWAIIVFTLFITGFSDRITLTPFSVVLNPLILEFVAGMVAALLFTRLSPSAWPFPLVIGLLLTGSFFLTEDADRVFLGLALAPVVLGLALAEVHFAYRVPKEVLLLGGASYSIYLVHNPIQSIVARVASSADHWALTFIASCVTGVAVGIGYHLLFERPALCLLSHRPARVTPNGS